MPKITVNGSTIVLPDGASEQDIEDSVNDFVANNHQPQQQALTNERIAEIYPTKQESFKTEYGGGTRNYAMPAEQAIAENKQFEENALAQRAALQADLERQKRIKKIDDDGILSAMADSATNEVLKLGQGGSQLIDDYLPQSIADALNYEPFTPGGGGDINQRNADRKIANDAVLQNQEDLNAARPISSLVGGMAPYLVTGSALDKALISTGQVISPLVKEFATNTLMRAGGVANRVKSGAGEGLITKSMNMQSKPALVNPYSEAMGNTARAATVGGIEGGVNYNQTALGGATAGGIGAALLNTITPSFMKKAYSYNDATRKNIVQQMERDGITMPPGAKLNNRRLQQEEAGIKNSDEFGDLYHQKITRPNERVMTDLAADSIGLPKANRDLFSQEELVDHMARLRSEYTALENTTTGSFTRGNYDSLNEILRRNQPTASRNLGDEARQNYNTLQNVMAEIRGNSTPQGDKWIFDGSQYQKMRQRIQEDKSRAFANGNQSLGRQLGDIQKILDDALESGMTRSNANHWKDLNERYSMTKMLMDNGLDAQGKINPAKITSAVMKKGEAERTLTGSGNRIKGFQKIARYNAILDDVEGGSLTGLSNSKFQNNKRGVLPFLFSLPLKERTRVNLRLSQLPIHGFSDKTIKNVGQALGVSEGHTKLTGYAKRKYQDLVRFLNEE